MRSVTAYPPMTLIVASRTAAQPIIVFSSGEEVRPAIISAPNRVMPEIALDADISGVCKVAGTLFISSKPR